jgi:AmiR/NasT family two-component response regulator
VADIAERLNTLLPSPPPIIFLTASKQPGLLDQACKLGAAGFREALPARTASGDDRRQT